MKIPPVNVPRLVVRSDPPGRRRLAIGVLLLAVTVLLWGAFQWGRGNLGLPGGITPDRVTLRDRVNLLEGEVRTLALAARERTELARTIGSLRGDVQRLESELGFYRGVVGSDGPADALKVQQFRITPMPEAYTYRLRMVLGRPLNPQGNVSGRLRMTFEGGPGSEPAQLDLAEAAGVEGGELPFDFRYLQEVEQVIRLPPGFIPARPLVERAPARRGVNPVRESFAWTLEN